MFLDRLHKYVNVIGKLKGISMRPAKRILLVSNDPEKLSVMAYTLRQARPAMQRGTYHVDTAASAQEALTSLICDKYDLMLCECPIERLDELAERSKLIGPYMPVVCISRGKAPVTYEGIAIDARLWKPPMAELLERILVMTASKRGPRKGFQAQRPVRTEWFTLPGKKTA